MHDCIRYVRETGSDVLDPLLSRLDREGGHAMQTRSGTHEETWESYAKHWEMVAQKLKNFLAVYDSVYPQVFWDIQGAMKSLLQRYPAVFWRVFWEYIGKAESSDHISYFKQYLIHVIAPSLLQLPHEGAAQNQHKLNGLQWYLDGVKRDRFAEQMSSLAMNQALIETDTTIYPHPANLSQDTIMGMDMSSMDATMSSKLGAFMYRP